MIRTLLVDDEPLARSRLRKLLADQTDLEILGEAETGAEAVLLIETTPADLVLLDIHLPDMDGFAVLEMLRMEQLPLVVFVTAFDQYAVDAFEVNAIDYVLKPVRHTRLLQTLDKVRRKLGTPTAEAGRLATVLPHLSQPPKTYLQRLPVRTQKRILILGIDQITSFRIDQGLVFVTSQEGEFWTKYASFGQLEDQLDPRLFLRVHRQHIVNLNHIREVANLDNTFQLTLTCGTQVLVSRNHIKELRQVLDL